MEIEVSPAGVLHEAVDYEEHRDDSVNDDGPGPSSGALAHVDLTATQNFDEPWRQSGNASFVDLREEDFRIDAWKTKLATKTVKLGAGAYGTVLGVKAQCDPTAEFAVKIQQLPRRHEQWRWEKEVLEEVEVMEALNTDKFVRILSDGPGHGRGPNMRDRVPRYSILMEKATGDLDKWTQANGYKSRRAAG